MTIYKRTALVGGDVYEGGAGILPGTATFSASVIVRVFKEQAGAVQPLWGNADAGVTNGWMIDRVVDVAGVTRYRARVAETVGGVITALASIAISQFASKATVLTLTYADAGAGLRLFINGHLAATDASGGVFIPGTGDPTLHIDQPDGTVEDETFILSAGYQETTFTAANVAAQTAAIVDGTGDLIAADYQHRYSATFNNRFGTEASWVDSGSLAATTPVNLTRAGTAVGGVLALDMVYN